LFETKIKTYSGDLGYLLIYENLILSAKKRDILFFIFNKYFTFTKNFVFILTVLSNKKREIV